MISVIDITFRDVISGTCDSQFFTSCEESILLYIIHCIDLSNILQKYKSLGNSDTNVHRWVFAADHITWKQKSLELLKHNHLQLQLRISCRWFTRKTLLNTAS